jgi:hypothetical protein
METVAKKENNMKHITALLMALGLALPAITFGQDGNQRGGRPDGPPAGEAGGPPPRFDGQRPQQPPPLINVLDANHDGVIDEDEIKNASEALRKLDKNGDGKLTMDELRPPRPDGGPGGEGQRFGPGGRPDDAQSDGQRPRRNRPPADHQ